MSDFDPDPTRNYHGGNQESNDAHRSVVKTKQLTRDRIVKWVGQRGSRGATCDEVEAVSSLPHQTVSARITEAKALGLLVPSGEKRKTRSGRNAAVLVISESALKEALNG